MAEPDSWEDVDERPAAPATSAKPGGATKLNANAPSFSFNPAAASFTPSFAVAPARPPGFGLAPARTDPALVSPAPAPPAKPAYPADVAGRHSKAPVAGGPAEAAKEESTPTPAAIAARQAAPAGAPAAAAPPAAGEELPQPGTEASSSKQDAPAHAAETEGPLDAKEADSAAAAEGAAGAGAEEVPDTSNPAAVDGVADVLAEKMAKLDAEGSREPQDATGGGAAGGPRSTVAEVHPEEEEEEEQHAVERNSSTISSEVDDRDHLNLVFIGHVDAGKSTIGGQILFLSNMVDERTIQKYEREAKDKNRESWYMAYIMDTNEEERAKGKTVEVGRAHFETEKKRYTILDAPGHKNYVPNMISGASQADIGVLVIAARKGEFETGFERGGQTREHAQLAKTLGVSKLVVVVNKMDDPSVQWSQERYDEIKTKLTPFLKACGYNIKKDVQFLPISGLYGVNMKVRLSADVCPWYEGPSFFEVLDALEPPDRDPKGPLRMPLIDKYRDMGTVVMGKIESGTISRGDNTLIMPNKVNVKVVTIYRDDDEVETARPGENLRVRISGIEEEDISSGFVLSSISKPIVATVEFDAQLQILELLEHKAIFTAGYRAVLHVHAIVEECEIIELLQQIDPKTKKVLKKKPLFVKSNAIILCRIQVGALICVERFSDFPQLGRFTLRDEGKTVAIGKVTAVVTSD